MRIGFLGVGRIGISHATAIARHSEVSSLVLGDVDPERARSAADQLGAESASVEGVFDAGVDAIVIATATDSHADLIVRGVEAGLPVFCEKPVAPDVTGTLRVKDVVEAKGGTVQI